MQNLPATLIASLLTIVSLGTAYAANSDDDTPYVTQQEHAAPVTITELPGSEPSASEVGNSPEEGAELHSSNTVAETTSIEDQQQASKAYAERRQKMIEDCEQNHGVDCERQVDTELGAEAIPRRHVVHQGRPGGVR
jgi:hypothetical protein